VSLCRKEEADEGSEMAEAGHHEDLLVRENSVHDLLDSINRRQDGEEEGDFRFYALKHAGVDEEGADAGHGNAI